MGSVCHDRQAFSFAPELEKQPLLGQLDKLDKVYYDEGWLRVSSAGPRVCVE
jgi:hypothetical protein